MTDLAELAGRVEAAVGPSADVDRAIKALSGDAWDYSADWGPRDNCHPVAKAYTASLDIATSLFPPNTMYRSGHSALAPDPSMFFCDAVLSSGESVHSLAQTEPNARVAAALKARALSRTAAEGEQAS